MKHRYLLIEADAEVSAKSGFYFLNIGSSLQDIRDQLYVIGLAASRGWYFELYTAEVQLFLMNVAKSCYPSSKTPLIDLSIVEASVRDYVRAKKAGIELALNRCAIENRHALKSYLDANYRLSNRSIKILK